MDSTTQDILYKTFVAIAGEGGAAPDPMIDASQELASSVNDAAKAMASVGATWEKITPGPGGVQGGAAQGGTGGTAVVAPAGSGADATPVTLATAPLTAEAIVSAVTSVTAGKSSGTAAATSDSTTIGTSLGSELQSLFGMSSLAGTVSNALGSGSGSGGGGVVSTLESIGKGALGAFGLIWDLVGLFGGGDSAAPPALVKYALPPKLAFDGTETEGGVSWSDYDQMGMPRANGAAEMVTTRSRGQVAPAPQITVNVQAMDARSFLDRSSDIAAAVRDAMLNLNAINDVVNEL